jgi:hypothetical protein
MQTSLLCALGLFGPILMLKSRVGSLSGLVLVVVYLFLVRLSLPQLDMIHYSNYLLGSEGLACVANPYYWREPLFWCGAPILHQLLAALGAEGLTFLLIDMSLVVLSFRLLKGYENRGIILFLLVFSLPSFLGINNIYRQWIAMMLFIPVLVYFLEGRFLVSAGWCLVACLAHNSSFILFAIIFFIALVRRFSLAQIYLLFTVFITLILSILSGAVGQKAGEFSTGLNVAPALAFIVFILSILCYKPISRLVGPIYSRILVIYLVTVDIFLLITVSSGASERISLHLIFFYMAAFLLTARVKPAKIFYLGFFLLNFAVILASPSTRGIAFNYFT